jgi:uncharacterized protein YndB with AHSA1/START domain
VLLADEFYRDWTSAFIEGSFAESDWQQGSEVLFLSPGRSGMYSVIEVKDEPNVIEFNHLGEVKDGVKQASGKWSGARERYELRENDSTTELRVEMDIEEDFLEYFEKIFPIALSRVKELAESDAAQNLTVETTIGAPVEKVWRFWTEPEHIVQWNNASDDWHTPQATNDLRVGGRFSSTMAAKDGSSSFDFNGVYDEVVIHEKIAYTIEDGRKVIILFKEDESVTRVIETFEAEGVYPIAIQRAGWQAIMDNFKKHVVAN